MSTCLAPPPPSVPVGTQVLCIISGHRAHLYCPSRVPSYIQPSAWCPRSWLALPSLTSPVLPTALGLDQGGCPKEQRGNTCWLYPGSVASSHSLREPGAFVLGTLHTKLDIDRLPVPRGHNLKKSLWNKEAYPQVGWWGGYGCVGSTKRASPLRTSPGQAR